MNSTHQARPGSLKATVERAAPNDVVCAVGGAHDPRSEITVPEDVTVRTTSGWIEPTADTNIFYLEHGARVDVKAITPSTWTSSLVVVDSSRAGGPYRYADAVEANILHRASGQSGTTLDRIAVDSSITVGCEFSVNSVGAHTAIRGYSEDAFINGPNYNAVITAPHTAVRHEGTTNFQSQIRGVFQPATNTQYGLRNTSGDGQSVHFIGEFWDPGGCDQHALAGKGVRVTNFTASTATQFEGTTDGSNGQFVRSFTNSETEYLKNGTVWKVGPDTNGGWRVTLDGSEVYEIFTNGAITPQSGGYLNLVGDRTALVAHGADLTARVPATDEVAKHDGSDGTYSESLCVEQGGVWYNIADATTM